MFSFPLRSWPALAIAVVAALVLSFIVVAVVALIVRGVARRRHWGGDPFRHIRVPFRVLVIVALVWTAVAPTWPLASWREHLYHTFLVVTIAAGAWLLGALLGVAIGRAMGRYRIDVVDNRVARRVRTQLAILRRLVYVIVFAVALGAILLTFPGVQAVGTSVLASAGVISVVAGLAAQSTLANVFAGIQLAFSDAIRIDDVVVVDQQWGRIEEITLSYVVVHIWDDRRLVLPSTYFTQNPFENWTRTSSELLGAVEFDLDWRVSPSRMRDELDAILDGATLWDGRVKVLQVTDAVGGQVHVRVLVTAKDAPTLFDLRCYVRERFVEWLQRETPEALPVQRVEVENVPATKHPVRRRAAHPSTPEGLFSGSTEGEERAHAFTGTVPVVVPDDQPDR